MDALQRDALASLRLTWAPTSDDLWRPQAATHVNGLNEHAVDDVMDAFGDAMRDDAWLVTITGSSSPESARVAANASAISSGERGSTTYPVAPSTTVSGAPPDRPTTTGSPVAAASRKTIPSASGSRPHSRVRHGSANTSAAA